MIRLLRRLIRELDALEQRPAAIDTYYRELRS